MLALTLAVLTQGADPVDHAEAPLADLALNHIISNLGFVFVGATERFCNYVAAVVVSSRCELVILSALVLLTAITHALVCIGSTRNLRLSVPVGALFGRARPKLFMRGRKWL